MVITLPFLDDMQQFSLSDPGAGTLLVTADLNSAISTFCTDYSSDPDCLARATPVKAQVPDSSLSFMLATVFSASVIIAAGPGHNDTPEEGCTAGTGQEDYHYR